MDILRVLPVVSTLYGTAPGGKCLDVASTFPGQCHVPVADPRDVRRASAVKIVAGTQEIRA